MIYRSSSLVVAMLAAVSFAFLSGCQDASTTAVSEASTAVSDHDGHDDHDHGDHEGHDHGDHEGHDHDDHEGHDHDDHEGHDHDDHEGHDHGDHEGHDHGDHEGHSHDFKTLGDAVAEIVELSDAIGEGFKSGDIEAAHGPLHHVGEVLSVTEDMVGGSEMPEDKKKVVMAAIEDLFDGFGDIDKSLHGDSGKKYEDVSASINQAIETLKKEAK